MAKPSKHSSRGLSAATPPDRIPPKKPAPRKGCQKGVAPMSTSLKNEATDCSRTPCCDPIGIGSALWNRIPGAGRNAETGTRNAEIFRAKARQTGGDAAPSPISDYMPDFRILFVRCRVFASPSGLPAAGCLPVVGSCEPFFLTSYFPTGQSSPEPIITNSMTPEPDGAESGSP